MSNGEIREGSRTPTAAERGPEREAAKEPEKTPEQRAAAAAEARTAEKQQAAAPAAARAATVPQAKDPGLMRVERVLEENLSDIYFALPSDKREKFKAKGEETAMAIKALVDRAKAKARDVLRLIRDWLKLIPHVNKYFLEQEAKIKTDRVMRMIEDKKNAQGL